ncbi:MAG: hypothetical protein ACYDAI_18255 [Trichloromonadaceae bacterium]
MPLSSLLIDTVSLLKKNGEKIEGIKASVQSNKIYIMRNDILIESGDIVQRNMSNGGKETFTVIDPGFHEGLGGVGGIPAGYQMNVKKMGIPEAEKAIQKITYNISGPNARVNNNSTDNSINTVNINKDIAKHIAALRVEIKNIKISNEERASAVEIVDAIETQFKTGHPSKTVVATLLKALPSAGSIASIGSFLLSCFGG